MINPKTKTKMKKKRKKKKKKKEMKTMAYWTPVMVREIRRSRFWNRRRWGLITFELAHLIRR